MVVEIKGLNKKFKEFELKDISLVVPRGSIVGLIGANGAGKSTIISCLCDMLKPDSGSISVFSETDQEKRIESKNDIGYVLDDDMFFFSYKIKSINAVMKLFYKNWQENVFFSLCEKFGINKKGRIGIFSKGMKTKVQLAIALSHKAKLLILDEPTSGLDPVARIELMDLFLEFMQEEGNSILFSTHITTDLEKVADYVTFIDMGKNGFNMNKDEMLYGYTLLKGDVPSGMDFVRRIGEGVAKSALICGSLSSCNEKYPDSIFERPTIEQIMYLHLKGEKGNG